LPKPFKLGGYAIIATFAPDGPEQCIGLTVKRYDAETLGQTLRPGLRLMSTRRREHVTSWGAAEPF
jgi:hypothetical protein